MQAADAGDVAELIRQSFDERFRPFLVYCQPGLDAYLRANIK